MEFGDNASGRGVNPIMKFYFCENCGDRLTEGDIAEGKARDKKLKGVFCQSCAVGVMTMESAPVTEGDARRLLAKGKSSSSVAPAEGDGEVKWAL